jgi:homoserine O-acetyltransferase/O-succinyltransferase
MENENQNIGKATCVSDIMSTKVVTVSLNHTVKQALKLLFDHKISGAPILSNDGKVEGLVSSLDLLVASGLRQFDIKLHELSGTLAVRKEVVHIYEDEPIKNALILIVTKHIGRVIVLDHSGHLAGIVTRNDIMKYYVKYLDL